MPKLTGQCLCGDISFEADGEIAVMANCHCTDCRKSTGAAYATLLFMNSDEVNVSGTLSTYQHSSATGNTMTKSFCGKCGGPMFTQNSAREGKIGLRAGTINEQEHISPKANVYVSSKLDFTPMDQAIPAFDKMPG